MLTRKYKVIPLAFLALFVALFVLTPPTASAHQPRITESRLTTVSDPEVSKAYYAKLTGVPDVYVINAPAPFDLYVGILVPDIKSTKKDILAEVFKDSVKIATIGGADATWKPFFEPFGQSNYFDGGEYKARAEAGVYTIKVSNPDNTGKYSLAVGEIEAFDGKEGANALSMIPDLKRDFFEESPISFILSPFGWGLIVIMDILAFIVGFIYRAILKKFARRSAHGAPKNIGKKDRLIRVAIGVGLLLWAITTTWSPILVFFSGFAFFEAIFSWCGFYAAMGKNTCPVE
ncbi:MAG: hypothetical protein RL641_532 [Candidatus Parcubacteria bacterium]|jgi:hypothetical protein